MGLKLNRARRGGRRATTLVELRRPPEARLGNVRGSQPAGHAYHTACAAPSIQLRFDPNGLVTTCCKSSKPLGHIAHQSLPEIWAGANRAEVAGALERDDFSVGCQLCGSEIELEGRAVSYAAIHDQWAAHLRSEPSTRAWPVRLELNLSNSCNLQCIQCDGDSSSAIRAHRENRPPLPPVYDDEFFDDLATFLPHVDQIVFAGGEPFLGKENFRVWDMIAEMNPAIDCTVVTNATQWTSRIERILERLRFHFIFSLDGITKQTYESIRVGADLEVVMRNVERFQRYAAERGTNASVNHCLMVQNAHEFPELLLWAEERSLHVDVSVVRFPAHTSIAQLPTAEISRISDRLERRSSEVRSQLSINRSTWDGELERIRSWSLAASSDLSSHTVLWFSCAGHGPTDDAEVVEDLRAWSSDGAVRTVVVGQNGLVESVDDATRELLGKTIHEFTRDTVAAHGEMNDYEVTSTSDDVVLATARFGATPARIAMVALRDDTGWAASASVSLAFRAANP